MCIAFILNIKQTGNLHDGKYITSANLEGAAESLRLRYAVEMRNENLDDEADSESWKKHEQELAGYAGQLQEYREATFRQSKVIRWAYLGSAFLILIATLFQCQANQPGQTSAD